MQSIGQGNVIRIWNGMPAVDMQLTEGAHKAGKFQASKADALTVVRSSYLLAPLSQV